MLEELGMEVEIRRLLWIVEDFFQVSGREWREMSLLFEIGLPEGSSLLNRSSTHQCQDVGMDGEPVTILFRWFPIESLEGFELYPTFLRQALRRLPLQTEHIIHRDA